MQYNLWKSKFKTNLRELSTLRFRLYTLQYCGVLIRNVLTPYPYTQFSGIIVTLFATLTLLT